MYFDCSWQGVGVSSTPTQREDPISLHMLAYLKYGSEHSREHVVVVADDLQMHNYTARFGLPEDEALKIALQKGDRKARQLSKLCKANGFANTSVVKIADVRDVLLETELLLLYERDSSFNQAVRLIIPDRFTGDRDALAQYTLGEIAFALTMEGTRISHQKQKPVDELIAKAHTAYGMGKHTSFHYPSLGLEYDPRSGMYIEPYSGLPSPQRVLVTDRPSEFERKICGLKGKQRERLLQQLIRTWEKDPRNASFYDCVVQNSARKLNFWSDLQDNTQIIWETMIRPMVFMAALLTATTMTDIGEQKETDYLTLPYAEFSRRYPPMKPEYREFYGDLDETPGDIRASADQALKSAKERKAIRERSSY